MCRCCVCAVCKDPGALMAVIVANAREAESSRGALGLLNWVGEQILVWAHRARHNSGERRIFYDGVGG